MLTIANRYIYDHVGRKLKTWEQITNGTTQTTRTLLSQVVFNEAGQVWYKQLHSTDSLNFLQTVAYTYNERGWLLQSTSPVFEEQLQYNQVAGIAGISPVAQYNGNIASQSWGTSTALNSSSFVYSYDALNRLTQGRSADNKFIERGISYDLMGNINTLSRVYNSTLIDSMAYAYNSTNQLQSVYDKSPDAGVLGYKTGNWTYAYDGNGNMITDNSKSISKITYNLLNLPQSIAALNTTYTYDAGGQKLRRVIGTATTDYIDGIEYDNGVLAFIQTEEGRALPNGTTLYNYEYSLSDHLGDERITFDSHTTTPTIVQQDNYMPFGMDISVGSVVNPQNNYLYNKKELQGELAEYDYGARFYDPVIARWNTVDPLAEQDRRWSPYVYGFDNSIRFEDPDGMWPDWGQIGVFIASVSADLGRAANNLKYVAEHPFKTIRSLEGALRDNGAGVKKALIHATVKTVVKYATGDKYTKTAVLGTFTGELLQFGFSEVTKVGEVAKLAEGAKIGEGATLTEKFLFRGDSRVPSDIFANGFLSKGDYMNLSDHAANNPANSGFISTSFSPNVSRAFAGDGGFVYIIKPPAIGFDVNLTLGSSSPFPMEKEFAIPNSIPSSSILGARQVGSDGTFIGPFIPNK